MQTMQQCSTLFEPQYNYCWSDPTAEVQEVLSSEINEFLQTKSFFTAPWLWQQPQQQDTAKPARFKNHPPGE